MQHDITAVTGCLKEAHKPIQFDDKQMNMIELSSNDSLIKSYAINPKEVKYKTGKKV